MRKKKKKRRKSRRKKTKVYQEQMLWYQLVMLTLINLRKNFKFQMRQICKMIAIQMIHIKQLIIPLTYLQIRLVILQSQKIKKERNHKKKKLKRNQRSKNQLLLNKTLVIQMMKEVKVLTSKVNQVNHQIVKNKRVKNHKVNLNNRKAIKNSIQYKKSSWIAQNLILKTMKIKKMRKKSMIQKMKNNLIHLKTKEKREGKMRRIIKNLKEWIQFMTHSKNVRV